MTRWARWRRAGLLVLLGSAVLASVTASGATVTAATDHTAAQVLGLVGVITEPSKLGSSAGMTPVYDFVLSAKKSVDMTMYELVDPTMVGDLVADQRRHVKVRVILDTNREASRNEAAFQALRAGGVEVVWADTSYEATHQKTITVDGTESLILSANLTDEYYTTTRDFGVFDRNPQDVSAIEAVFAADFTHEPVQPSDGSDLVWSPGSQAKMLAVIQGAKHTLSIENEEMGDWTITDAIVAAARRGVKVEVTMTKDSSYDSDWNAIVSRGRSRASLPRQRLRLVHPCEDDDRRCRIRQRTDLPRKHQLLACFDGRQSRARHHHGRCDDRQGRQCGRHRGLHRLHTGHRLQPVRLTMSGSELEAIGAS